MRKGKLSTYKEVRNGAREIKKWPLLFKRGRAETNDIKWILAKGRWSDDGIWMDEETWND